MKKFTLLLTSIFLISSCSQSDNQNQAETSDAPPSLVEYVWHKAGSEFSAENLAMLIRSWNGMIDDAMCNGMMGANILTPEVANEGTTLFGFYYGILKAAETHVGMIGLQIYNQIGTP